jgi:hypothetical protein
MRRNSHTLCAQPLFLMGLRARSVAIRRNFFDVFNRQIAHAATVSVRVCGACDAPPCICVCTCDVSCMIAQQRLDYIFGEQKWESMAKSFWMRQALDLLLSVRDVWQQL